MRIAVLRRRTGANRQEKREKTTERIREELDYTREAGHLRLFAIMLEGHARVAIPEPVTELSTQRLLTMTWLE